MSRGEERGLRPPKSLGCPQIQTLFLFLASAATALLSSAPDLARSLSPGAPWRDHPRDAILLFHRGQAAYENRQFADALDNFQSEVLFFITYELSAVSSFWSIVVYAPALAPPFDTDERGPLQARTSGPHIARISSRLGSACPPVPSSSGPLFGTVYRAERVRELSGERGLARRYPCSGDAASKNSTAQKPRP